MMRTALVVIALSSSSCGLFSDAECTTDTDCHGGHLCAAGKCVECKADRDCDTGETCIDAICERGGGEGEGEGAGGEGEGEGFGGEGEGEGFGGEGEGEGEGAAALDLRLSWDNVNADVDIHATKGTPYCIDPNGSTNATTTPAFGPLSQSCASAPLDCNYGNCKTDAFGATLPDWDGTGTVSSGDPVLVQDWIGAATSCPTTDPTCPPLEIIDVGAPVAGTYLVEAVYYGNESTSITGVANATLAVNFRGSPVKTVTTSLAAAGDTKDLVIIHVGTNGDVTCVGDVTDGVDECP